MHAHPQFLSDLLAAEAEAEMADEGTSEVEEEVELDPVKRVISAVHNDRLTRTHLEDANVVLPDDTNDNISTIINHLSDLIADSWPEPTTTEDLNDLVDTARDNIMDRESTSTTTAPTPTNEDFDADEEHPSQPGVPKNAICACESAVSGSDQVRASRGKLSLRLHFFYGSGNIEIRVTENRVTRGDLVAMESVYALWMVEDTVHLVLSCPSKPRKLKDGRWSEASGLSMFHSNKPKIEIKIKQEDVESTAAAVTACINMHTDILSQPERVPQSFSDDALIKRAAEFRAKTVFSRAPPHIRAFMIRNDPNASADERAKASELIASLVEYCNKHWTLYVETILKKKRAYGFPARCLCCGDATRWDAESGLRVGVLDKKDHQYCKKFTSNTLSSMNTMLSLPTIDNIWRKIRKSYDPGMCVCVSVRVYVYVYASVYILFTVCIHLFKHVQETMESSSKEQRRRS